MPGRQPWRRLTHRVAANHHPALLILSHRPLRDHLILVRAVVGCLLPQPGQPACTEILRPGRWLEQAPQPAQEPHAGHWPGHRVPLRKYSASA